MREKCLCLDQTLYHRKKEMPPIYNYRCNYCSREWEEVLEEKDKLAPTKVMQPIECDIFIAPHAGMAKCDIELVEEEPDI